MDKDLRNFLVMIVVVVFIVAVAVTINNKVDKTPLADNAASCIKEAMGAGGSEELREEAVRACERMYYNKRETDKGEKDGSNTPY